MSNVKISALPTGTIAGTDTVPVVKAGVTTAVPFSHTHPESDVTNLVSDLASLQSQISAVTTTLSPIQGRIQVDSTSQISLQRYQGALIPIKKSGTWQNSTIPSSGPTLSNTGLTAGTLYYIYAFDSSGTLTLEASTTTHATDSTSGVEIKSGDATRTLLGMVYMGTGTPGTFVDSVTSRTCVNWANRRDLDMLNMFTTSRTSTSTAAWAEINSEIELTFCTWATEAVYLFITGTGSNNTGGAATGTAVGVDSTSSPSSVSAHTNPSAQGSLRGNIAVSYVARVSEGKHFATILGKLSSGTATWVATDSVETDGAAATRFWGAVRG